MGKWMYRSAFLNLIISWRYVVSFTPRPLYLRGKSPRCPLDRRLGRPQNRSDRHVEEKNFTPTGTILQLVANRYTDSAIAAPFEKEMKIAFAKKLRAG
jgi:hypothetical protein